MSAILAILSTILQIVVKVLYISAKVTIKTAKLTTKTAVKAGKTIHKTEKATRDTRKKVRKTAVKTVKKGVNTAKQGVNKVKKVSQTASRGAKNVKNSVKSTADLLGNDSNKKDSVLEKIKSGKLRNKAVGLVVNSPVMMLKLTLKMLKGLLSLLRVASTLFVFGAVFLPFVSILLACAIFSCVTYAVIFSESNVVEADTNQSNVSVSDDSFDDSSSTSVAKDWIIINQSAYSDVAYSTNSSNKKRGTVSGQGCGLCSLITVSEHYSGNSGKYTVADGASEIDTNFNNKGTNLDTSVIPWWFNTAHTELGLSCTNVKDGDMNLDELDSVLASGGCAIVDYHSDVKYGKLYVWTTAGHYITIISGNQKDGYMVRDSNGSHEDKDSIKRASSGVPDWCPYSTHVFSKEYIQPTYYYYYITKK